ncbi:MAG: high-affinity branched-chain amino acid transport protein superfamily, atp bind [Frankiales bacterium]|nr:high-affinity branched-chain amino acid transport protein superfamily, atp bind [Frankiales bacterium]
MKVYIALALGGIPLGAMYALQALGIVIVYKTSKVFNFASGAIGLVCAYFASSLGPGGWFTRILAVLAATLVGLVVGVLMELTVRPVKGALTGTIVTLGWLLTLTGFVGFVYGTQAATHEPVQLAGLDGNRQAFNLFDVLQFSWQQLLLLGIAGALAAGLAAFFRLTDLGTATRAVSEAPDAARLLGIAVDRVNLVAWGLGGAVSGLAGVLVAPLLGPLDNTSLIILTVQALAAALVGRLSSLPLTVAGGIALGMLQPVIHRALHSFDGVKGTDELTAFAVVLIALLFFKRSGRKDVVSGGLTPVPIRPLPRGGVAIASFLGIAVAALAVPSLVGDAGKLTNYNVSQVAVWGTATLSLVLLVGVVGQVSVCQAVFMGCGAFGAGIALSHDVPFVLALALGGLLAAGVAALVGLPAIRLEPLELAIATLSLSFTADRFLYSWPPLAGENGRREIARPGFANVDPGHVGDGNRAYAWLVLGIFIAACFAVASLRRGRTGAALTALRSSEPATAAMGFSVTSVKLRGFAASGFLAGVAGAMYGGLIQSATGAPFDFSRSITLLAYAVIIGVGSVPGAFFGGLLVTLTTLDFGATNGVANGHFVSLTTMVTGLFLIGVLMASPDGIAGAIGRLQRDSAPEAEAVLV